MTQPWERQPTESSKAWHAFVVYRDMGGDRSLRHMSPDAATKLTQLGMWSRKNKWVERCAAWDAEQDRVNREAILDARRQTVDRIASEARAIQARAMVPTRELLQRAARKDKTYEKQLASIPVGELMRYGPYNDRAWIAAVRIECIMRGIPIEAVLPEEVLKEHADEAEHGADDMSLTEAAALIQSLVPTLSEDQHSELLRNAILKMRTEEGATR